MLAKVLSSAVMGVEAYLINVEVDIAQGLPNFNTVGLPDAAVKESRDRVRAAIKNCGFDFPGQTDHREPGRRLTSKRRAPASTSPSPVPSWRPWV